MSGGLRVKIARQAAPLLRLLHSLAGAKGGAVLAVCLGLVCFMGCSKPARAQRVQEWPAEIARKSPLSEAPSAAAGLRRCMPGQIMSGKLNRA